MILPLGLAQGSPVCLGAEPSPAWPSLSLDSHSQRPFWADHSLTLPTEWKSWGEMRIHLF